MRLLVGCLLRHVPLVRLLLLRRTRLGVLAREERRVDARLQRRLDMLLVARISRLARHLEQTIPREVGLVDHVAAELLAVALVVDLEALHRRGELEDRARLDGALSRVAVDVRQHHERARAAHLQPRAAGVRLHRRDDGLDRARLDHLLLLLGQRVVRQIAQRGDTCVHRQLVVAQPLHVLHHAPCGLDAMGDRTRPRDRRDGDLGGRLEHSRHAGGGERERERESHP
mmetsp:Transcript_11064/g.27441  ORF Transcript_11064/g.27441 Transcript_11064/m.27441 type:complete len:228 (+) Transcript_11064:1183-1866(+)